MPASNRWVCVMGMMLLAGCGSSTPPPVPSNSTANTPAVETTAQPAKEEPVTPSKQAAPGIQTQEPDDLSLTPQEYLSLGLPKCERLWNSGDMVNASKVLAEIAKRDASQLPRFGSPKSGKVFARITSDENLDQIRAKSLPGPVRLGFGLQFLQAATSISKSYTTGLLQQKTGGDETAELVSWNLRIAVVLSGLVDEFKATLDKKDPTFTTRLSGLTQMNSTMSSVLQSALLRASEPKALKPDTLDRLLKSFDENFPILIKTVPPAVRKETVAKLREMSDKPEYATHRELLVPIIDKLEKAIQEASDE
jgi:hypothetical protein